MATPTFDQLKATLQEAAGILDTASKYNETNADSVLTETDTLMATTNFDWKSDLGQAVSAFRSRSGSLITAESAQLLFNPIMRGFGKLYGYIDESPAKIASRLYTTLHGTHTVKTRGITRGSSPQTLTGTGTGKVYRLTTDAKGYAIENAWVETVTAKCVRDQGDTYKHEEQFELKGLDRDGTKVCRGGSGLAGSIVGVSAREGSNILKNGSFSNGTAGSTTGLTNWTATTTSWDFDTTNKYRSFQGDPLDQSLKVTATTTFTQSLATIGKGKVTSGRENGPLVGFPMFLAIAWNGQVGAAAGSFTISIGASSESKTYAAEAGWNVTVMTLGTKSWYEIFKQTDMNVGLAATLTGGYWLFDDFILCQMTPFGGLYYTYLGGVTPAMRGDYVTFTDTKTESVIQYWLWHAYGEMWPHSAAPTITDPT